MLHPHFNDNFFFPPADGEVCDAVLVRLAFAVTSAAFNVDCADGFATVVEAGLLDVLLEIAVGGVGGIYFRHHQGGSELLC